LKQGIKEIGTLADPTGGELRIVCSEAFSNSVLRPILRAFLQTFPRVAVQVNDTVPLHEHSTLDERKNDLLMGFWVKPLTLDADHLNIDVLFDDHLVVAAGTHTRLSAHTRTRDGRG
jgi:DNA-binding transcriptional LysR family regulator